MAGQNGPDNRVFCRGTNLVDLMGGFGGRAQLLGRLQRGVMRGENIAAGNLITTLTGHPVQPSQSCTQSEFGLLLAIIPGSAVHGVRVAGAAKGQLEDQIE